MKYIYHCTPYKQEDILKLIDLWKITRQREQYKEDFVSGMLYYDNADNYRSWLFDIQLPSDVGIGDPK